MRLFTQSAQDTLCPLAIDYQQNTPPTDTGQSPIVRLFLSLFFFYISFVLSSMLSSLNTQIRSARQKISHTMTHFSLPANYDQIGKEVENLNVTQNDLCSVRPCAFFSMFLVTRPHSFWLKTKTKTKKTEAHKIRAVERRYHVRNTCTLHLQTRLTGPHNFFTVIARRRKKDFLLLRSLMEVDDRVNVSNHYSKKHAARHSCILSKALRTSCVNQAEAFSKRVTLSSH